MKEYNSLLDFLDDDEEETEAVEFRTFTFDTGNYTKYKRLIGFYHEGYYTKKEYEENFKKLDSINGNDITFVYGNLKENLYIYYIHLEDEYRYFFECDDCIIGLSYQSEYIDIINREKLRFPACAICWFNTDGTIKKDYLKPSKLYKTKTIKNITYYYDYRDDIILGKWHLREYGELADICKKCGEKLENANFCSIEFTIEDLTQHFGETLGYLAPNKTVGE